MNFTLVVQSNRVCVCAGDDMEICVSGLASFVPMKEKVRNDFFFLNRSLNWLGRNMIGTGRCIDNLTKHLKTPLSIVK